MHCEDSNAIAVVQLSKLSVLLRSAGGPLDRLDSGSPALRSLPQRPFKLTALDVLSIIICCDSTTETSASTLP